MHGPGKCVSLYNGAVNQSSHARVKPETGSVFVSTYFCIYIGELKLQLVTNFPHASLIRQLINKQKLFHKDPNPARCVWATWHGI